MQPKLCSRCHKNVAVVFITKLENNEQINEGLCLKCAREMGIKPRRPEITVSTSMFIPKPFTPFQWERQSSRGEVEAKIALLRKELLLKGVSLSWNDYSLSGNHCEL